MSELKSAEPDAVSGGDFELNGSDKSKPKDDSKLDEVIVRGRRMLGSIRIRIGAILGLGGVSQITVNEAIDNNGDVIEEVEVVADRINDNDVPRPSYCSVRPVRFP